MAKSSSSSSVATTNQAIDKRVAVESGIGISSDGSTVNIQSIDADLMKETMNVLGASDAVKGEGFARLLNLADKLFDRAGGMVERTQNTALEQLDTLNRAQNDARGSIDQKTLMVIAIAGAAMVIVPKMKRGK